MTSTNELRVFISSTFRDLQEEREHLIKKIFPEIRSLCRSRGITFTEVDLRWGITEDDVERTGVVQICLEEIDRCRPYFIGILGERYGWTPPASDVEGITHKFPSLGISHTENISITEMEILHGVLTNPDMIDHALFYFRDPWVTPVEFIDTDANAVRKLKDLKYRIRQSGFPVRENFTSAAELGRWLQEDLRRVLDSDYPENETPSPVELERRLHAAFALSRIRGYVANPTLRTEFASWLNTGQKPLVITGASGLGKSSLIAFLVDEYRRGNPSAFIVEHYIGASEQSGSALAVMRHVIEEIRRHFAIDEPLPEKPELIERSFLTWLYRLEQLARKHGIPVLIAIDALNQLDQVGSRLTWLPKTLPSGVKLVISTTPGPIASRIAERDWNRMEVAPMHDWSIRQSIVAQYLKEFRKSMTDAQLRHLTSDAKAASPLYLRVVAEELRLHGVYETLDAEIARFASAHDLDEVFQRVLERLERDYSAEAVRGVLESIWASRVGLRERELIDIPGLNRLTLSRLLLALDYHLVRKDGLLGLFHDYLRRAVQQRYLGDDEDKLRVRRRLIRYFENVVPSQHAALELMWQYRESADDDRLANLLQRPEIVVLLSDGESRWEVLQTWARLQEHGVDVETAYRTSLASWQPGQSAPERASVLLHVAWLLQNLSCWDSAEEVFHELARLGREEGEKTWEISAHGGLGRIQMAHGDYAGAMHHQEQAHRLAEEIGDRNEMAGAIANMASIYGYQGRYPEALEYSLRCLSMSEELGDHKTMATAVRNIGVLHYYGGRYTEALESYRQCITLSEELGDRSGMASVIGNMGVVYKNQGEFAEAQECYQRQRTISQELGDRRGAATAVGTLGNLCEAQGLHAQALEYYQHALAEHRAIGFLYGITFWLQGITHIVLEAALEEEDRPEFLRDVLEARPDEPWTTAALRMARTLAEECRDVSREISNSDTFWSSRIFLARIQAAEASPESALQLLDELLIEATDDARRAELYYWLWKLGHRTQDAGRREENRGEAARLYTELFEKTPKHDYHVRIEELKASGIQA